MFSTSVFKLVLFFCNDVNILLVFILVSDWVIEMRNSIIEAFEKRSIQKIEALPSFRSGDTVRVYYKIQETAVIEPRGVKGVKGVKETKDTKDKKVRIQHFEGVVIRYKKGVVNGSFTVRKIGAGGIGVERVFPLYSPTITRVEVKARGIVRRSRLFYLRQLSGKAARIRSKFGGVATAMAATATEEETSQEN